MSFRAIYHYFKKRRGNRICITTYFDDAFAPIGNLCYETLQIYAAKYRLDTVLLNPVVSSRPTPWHKILVINQLFDRQWEYVFWIDADAIFVDYRKNIVDEIEGDKDLYLVKHDIDSKEVPNSGVFLIKNSAWSHRLLDQMWEKQEYIHHKWWENAALIDILGYHELINENDSRRLKPDLMKKIKWLGLEWNSLPNICESQSPLIKHYAGRPFEERIRNMSNDFRMNSKEKLGIYASGQRN